jgi:hypothetical protein
MPPKKPATKKPPPKDSIRIKLGGSGNQWTIAELRALAHEGVDRIAAAGITHVKGCNLYVSPVDSKGQPITRTPRGQQLSSSAKHDPRRI